jgi:hypothetical protein
MLQYVEKRMKDIFWSSMARHGWSGMLPVQWQEEVKHQWVPRVGILDPPEMGYGWWSYGEPCCKCVEHRGDSCPMYVDA